MNNFQMSAHRTGEGVIIQIETKGYLTSAWLSREVALTFFADLRAVLFDAPDNFGQPEFEDRP